MRYGRCALLEPAHDADLMKPPFFATGSLPWQSMRTPSGPAESLTFKTGSMCNLGALTGIIRIAGTYDRLRIIIVIY